MPLESLPSSTQQPQAPFLPFGMPLIGEAEIAEVVDTLRSGWLGTGPKTQRFEAAFATYVGAPFSLALNSCTAGLHLALDVLGVGPGDEVLTTPMTFVATANVIIHRGATPVFADVDPLTGNLDPVAAARAITPKTKAMLVVHYTGRAADMGPLMQIARRHKLAVIEDCAHAIETTYHGIHAGNFGDIAAYSFYATKNLVTGEGGMVTCRSSQINEALRIRSLHGLNRDAWKRYSAQGSGGHYEAVYPGYKYNMMDIQASLGIHQLAAVERHWQRRRTIWQRYNEAFAGLPGITIPAPDAPGTRHAYHLYTVSIDPQALRLDRDGFMAALREAGIGTGVHFRPVHLQRWYRERYGYHQGQFPHAESIGETTLSLPLSPALQDPDVERVIANVTALAKRYKR